MADDAATRKDHWFRTFLWTIAIPGIAFALYQAADDKRKERLDFVRLQIEKLYGPLYALSITNHAAWEELKTGGPRVTFDDPAHPLTAEDVARWRRWSNVVFIENDKSIEDTIMHNAQYIDQREMTGLFTRFFMFSAHFKVLSSGWKDDDAERKQSYYMAQYNKPPINYPSTLRNCAESELKLLKYRMHQLEGVVSGAVYNALGDRRSAELDVQATKDCTPAADETQSAGLK